MYIATSMIWSSDFLFFKKRVNIKKQCYKRMKGIYQFDQFRLAIDHVQVDPFAPPSKMRVIIGKQETEIPNELLDTKDKRIATSDFLTRTVDTQLKHFNRTVKGSGKNGKIFIDHPGQEILERTSVVINDKDIEIRIEVGLPAAGRKILGKVASIRKFKSTSIERTSRIKTRPDLY